MSRVSQSQKVAEFLKENPGEKFTARQIAEAIIARYPEDYLDKRSNPRFSDEKAFLQQIVAEIGAQKASILRQDNKIHWQDKPRPRVYWFEVNANEEEEEPDWSDSDLDDEDAAIEVITQQQILAEVELYPLLVQYLKSEHHLYCLRIDEKRSRNSRGSGGNHWLHPDIVAMEPVAKGWNELVQTCVRQGGSQSVRLWAFEVKRELTRATVRKSFFQAVSNSSWANEGYLVTTSIADTLVEQELRMLSALHGIGVILLVTENPFESEILLPARARPEVDWQSANRIVDENEDFRDFIEQVSMYYQTGILRARDWNKI
ncbi:HrgA protein [Endozoicomonas sp. SM1973]|uniref:HrgA protein n=1 Tax=Spartinivicinus marinus TaxID=2994442 RepID=A0A853HZQ4_9GAMM|nr:HrgA protein [Spartinivicinus marinus]MCX4026748.1 hypothetical protein [Spartinivicinus marinus]NYZ64582.1 HrgA protein [Spartinivicinus marinus]